MTDKSVTERLDDGTRDAVNDFFDALSKWRDEVASNTVRYNETILAKMVPADTAMGWPKEVVEASRAYLAQASKMQLQVIDQFMDAWQAQAKSPLSSQFIAQLQPFAGAATGKSSGIAIAPVQLWMEAAQTWQRNWASVFSMWTDAGSRNNGSSRRR